MLARHALSRRDRPEGPAERPIVYDADAGGFLYQRSTQADTYELPGLWFSAAELQALAIMQRC